MGRHPIRIKPSKAEPLPPSMNQQRNVENHQSRQYFPRPSSYPASLLSRRQKITTKRAAKQMVAEGLRLDHIPF